MISAAVPLQSGILSYGQMYCKSKSSCMAASSAWQCWLPGTRQCAGVARSTAVEPMIDESKESYMPYRRSFYTNRPILVVIKLSLCYNFYVYYPLCWPISSRKGLIKLRSAEMSELISNFHWTSTILNRLKDLLYTKRKGVATRTDENTVGEGIPASQRGSDEQANIPRR